MVFAFSISGLLVITKSYIAREQGTTLAAIRFKFATLNARKLSVWLLISMLGDLAYSQECPATSDYLSDLKRFESALRKDLDYSCLTDYPSISKKIKTYQLIDIRPVVNSAIEHAWTIPVDELKHKHFLRDRSLLLLGHGFSRVSLASDCAVLKKAGFINVKMLVGGEPQWRQVSTRKNSVQSPQAVSARDLIVEYFNGRVSIISASSQVSEKLKKIGITRFNTLERNQFSAVSDLVVSTSNGGFDPVVYIGDPQSHLDFNKQHSMPNLYQLQGGVDALAAQLSSDALVEASRVASQGYSFCAK